MQITGTYTLPDAEIDIHTMRSQGAGGQNVNKVETAVQLRFDIAASSLPEEVRRKLLNLRDRRITKEGVIVLRAQRFRSRERNREDALERLRLLLSRAFEPVKERKPTKPSRNSRERRLEEKAKRSGVKSLRGPVRDA